MTIEQFVRAEMVRFAVEEGQRYGGINNMLAVLYVLRNRVFSGWGDWLEVVQRAPEKRAVIYPPAISNMRTNDVRIILNRVDEVYTRVDCVDLTGGALFYFDPEFTVQEWFSKEVLGQPEEHKRVAHIGPVWFYK